MAFTIQDPASHHRLGHLFGTDPVEILTLIQRYVDLFNRLEPRRPKRVVMAEADPKQYLCGVLAACQVRLPVFLANPHWQKQEWSQAQALVQSGYLLSQGLLQPFGPPAVEPRELPPWILIPTGGSSGQIRFAIHTWDTLAASVNAFQTYSQMSVLNSVCVLPPHHISGFMQMMRGLLTGGHLHLHPWRTLQTLVQQNWDPSAYCLSLVPTQLHRLLKDPLLPPWLQRFHLILLGGGPCPPALLALAQQARIPLAPTYGLTETASQIATLLPTDFLAGATSCGRILPHAQVEIVDPQGQPLPPHHLGQIKIQSTSLALGYYPDPWDPGQAFQTQDLGYFNVDHHLVVVGRTDDLILTGGEKVLAAEVENVLLASGFIQDVKVLGQPDPDWGQAVVALYVSHLAEEQAEFYPHLKAYLNEHLTAYKHPKRWIRIPALPRNEQGKLNQSQLLEILSKGSPGLDLSSSDD